MDVPMKDDVLDPNMLEFQKPMQVAILICGNWQTTKIPLEYLILFLNSKQNLFEYQLLSINRYVDVIREICGKGSEHDDLLSAMMHSREISLGKLQLKHYINDIACAIQKHISKNSDLFDSKQNPTHFIFLTTSKHKDETFFQEDGTNGFTVDTPCRGAIILTGHHQSKMAPPTVIEFIFKFLFRISIKYKIPTFTRKHRHFGQKGCLFDYNHEISCVRYMVLNNFICCSCRERIGNAICDKIINALDMDNIYDDRIERHPAKISSALGFNLSLVKGIYKSKYERISESISNSFFSRIGSLVAMFLIISTFYSTDSEDMFLGYIF
tara:strand:+ start:82 stop:1056 length:975 start_codon:yes stop_codon:yes gene_type:complete